MTTPTSTMTRPMHFDAATAGTDRAPSAHRELAARRRSERREYWVLYVVCFVFFIIATSIARLLSVVLLRRSEAPRSVWTEAKEEASLCAAIAFKG